LARSGEGHRQSPVSGKRRSTLRRADRAGSGAGGGGDRRGPGWHLRRGGRCGRGRRG
jgi:hypothetical protein